MGDPETEVVLPRIKSDMIDLFEGIATQTLSERHLEFEERTAATIMMVSGGYPEEFEKGKSITGLDAVENCLVFHAGTTEKGGKIVTNGGRVLAVTAFGKDIEQAIERASKGAEAINYDKKYYRKDIGFDLIKLPQQA
jgi:phosphoribosylamine--glycine ligase